MKQRTQLQRALDALDMTSADLARALTGERTDGRSTTKATVSRWVTEKDPTPAGVRLFLKRLLVERGRDRPPLLDGLQIVTVGGGKGGSGSTAISVFLAAAARARGYKISLGAPTGYLDSVDFFSRDFLFPGQTVTTVDLSNLAQARREMASDVDFLIVDVGNKTMLSEGMIEKIDLHQINLAVVPFNPIGPLDFHPAQMVARSFGQFGFKRFMLQPFMEKLSLGMLLQDGSLVDGLKEFSEHLSDSLIIKRSSVERPRGWFSRKDFQDDDLEEEYTRVLFEVLERLGVDEGSVERQGKDFENLGFEDLLHSLGQR